MKMHNKSVTTKLRHIFPESAIRGLKKAYNYQLKIRYAHRIRQLCDKGTTIMILATIARSGTHYTKFLIANYLKIVSSETDVSPVSPEEMNLMLPNTWHIAYLNKSSMLLGSVRPEEYKVPTPHLRLLGLHDIARSHFVYQTYFWNNYPVLHLYRNPLDYAVSRYYYMHRNRSGVNIISGPAEQLEIRFDDYVKMYLSYRKAVRATNTKVLRISYEDLIRYPEVCLRIVLRWLGVEPKDAHIEAAVENASINTVKKFESAGGAINPAAQNLVGQFVRDGSIGQWKKYFNRSEVEKFRKKFREVGINLDEFTLE